MNRLRSVDLSGGARYAIPSFVRQWMPHCIVRTQSIVKETLFKSQYLVHIRQSLSNFRQIC